MNPVDKFVKDFCLLFPNAVITPDYEGNDVVFYHNASLDSLSESDRSAYEHITTELYKAGVKHWLVCMED